ncbi:hypothetical protein H4R21_001005 [Coemansia helicoidea]|uniref:Uncharacterized protein n=1 Tax=Coemansia helicoidea TaxID=1286919 RepID=A0ACC1LDV5_9FUNG|nr:hypothetical protein H4R21_001005 [Coemansia helicoidea]
MEKAKKEAAEEKVFANQTLLLDGALMKISSGAAPLYTKANNKQEDAVDISYLTGIRKRLDKEIAIVVDMKKDERERYIKYKGYTLDLLNWVAKEKRLPVPVFAYGGILHPLDVAMVMKLGYDGVIVSKNVFVVNNPEKRVRSLVLATTHYDNPRYLADIIEDHGS